MARKKSKNKAAQGNSNTATTDAAAYSRVEAGSAATAAGPQQQAQPVASSSGSQQPTGEAHDPSKGQIPVGKPANPQQQPNQKESAGQPAAAGSQQPHPPADNKKQTTGGAQGLKPSNQQQPKQKQSQPNAGQPATELGAATPSSQQQPTVPVGSTEPQKPSQNQPEKPSISKQSSQPSVGQITVARAGASSGALKPPPRNGIGKLGRPIPLSANYFRVTIKNHYIYHYDVDINPMPPKALFKKVILEWMKSDSRIKDSLPVFDFKKNIYTAKPIPDIKSKIDVNYQFEEKDRENPRVLDYVISIQPTGQVEIDLSALKTYCESGSSTDPPLRPIQALDIALKYGAQKRPEKILLGTCLFTEPSEGHAVYLDRGLEVWFGHFQSLRLCSQFFLNIDVTQRPFLKSGKVHEIMAEIYGTRIGEKLRDNDYKDFSKKIATLKVKYSRGTYVANVGCNGLKFDKTGRYAIPANTEKFDYEGKMITVQQFFEDKLKKKLLYPYLPCVWVGSRDRNNLVPMELCDIPPGQEYRRKLSEFQTSEMIKVAAVPANERKQYTLDAIKDMQFEKDEHAKALGITVDTQMVKLQGRVLDPPKMEYSNGHVVPREGVWNMTANRTNLTFIDARKMLHFGVLNITRARPEDIRNFIAALTDSGRKMGMEMGSNLFIEDCKEEELEKKMVAAKEQHDNLQILIVIINKKRDPAHETVKRVGDLDLFLATQCVQSKNLINIRKGFPDPSTMSNICLKLNAKLGGINTIAREFRPQVLLKEQVIIMGADVTHPGADQQDSGKPSIAAVTGSLDPLASKYACEIRIQKSKQEHIQDMENMVYNLLLKFYRYNKGTSTGKPQRIIFYRDGVSEGQFAKILETEMTAIQRACRRLEDSYRPPITFIVVQKRHHTRLYPENRSDMCGKAGNVPPGTVVDTTIVHPTEGDFYLVSHLGIQGTSRPAHYHTLWDDSKFSSDEIQKMTYYLCHLFVRCTRSVSYPAPCYYSHLVAFRGREYYDNLLGRVTDQELQQKVDRWTNFMFFV